MMPFAPIDDATATIAVTSSNGPATPIKKAPTGAYQVRLYNVGPSTVFWAVGSSAVTAATSDTPIPSGAIEVVTVNNPSASPETYIAAVTSASTATLYVSTGSGY